LVLRTQPVFENVIKPPLCSEIHTGSDHQYQKRIKAVRGDRPAPQQCMPCIFRAIPLVAFT
jgi:hypothetical protein